MEIYSCHGCLRSGRSPDNGRNHIWLGGVAAFSIFLLSLFLRTKLSNMRILSACEGFGVFYGPQARVLSAVVMMVYMFMVGVVQVVAVGTIVNVICLLYTSPSPRD